MKNQTQQKGRNLIFEGHAFEQHIWLTIYNNVDYYNLDAENKQHETLRINKKISKKTDEQIIKEVRELVSLGLGFSEVEAQISI